MINEHDIKDGKWQRVGRDKVFKHYKNSVVSLPDDTLLYQTLRYDPVTDCVVMYTLDDDNWSVPVYLAATAQVDVWRKTL